MDIPIYRTQITKERWANTSSLRTDNKEEFREYPKYGNRHAVFEKGSDIGYIHIDEDNALDIPIGTINHVSKYVEEKTGIPKWLTNLVIVGIGLIVLVKAGKSIAKSL